MEPIYVGEYLSFQLLQKTAMSLQYLPSDYRGVVICKCLEYGNLSTYEGKKHVRYLCNK